MKKICTASLLLCGLANAAQEVQIEEIDVTSNSQIETMDDIQNEQINNPQAATVSSSLSKEIFTKKDIKKLKPASVYDILSQAKGVNVLFMGRKSSYTLSFRGSSVGVGNSSFGIILDGALLSNNSGRRILETLPPEIIESLEIVRDSSALSLAPMQSFNNPNGSTLQGYIIIKTKKPNKNEGGIKIAYESFNTKKTSAYYSGVNGNFYYLISANGLDTEGKNNYNNANEGGNGFFKIGFDKDDLTIELDGYYSRYFQEIQKANLPISKFYNAYWKYKPFENRLFNLSINKKWSTEQITNITLSHAKSNWKHDQDTTGTTGKSFTGSQTNDSVDIKHTIKIADTVLKFGGQAIWYDAPNGEFFYEGYQRKEQIYGAFIQVQHYLSEQFAIDWAIRADKRHIDTLLERYSPNVTTSYGGGVSNTKLSTIEDQWTKAAFNAAVGALYKIDEKNSLTAKFGYASNAPTSEISEADGYDLEKEEQYKYEIGYEFALPNFKTTANLFYYNIDNLKSPYYIGTAADPEIVFGQYDQQRYGGEITFGGNINSFDYLFSYAYVKADEKDNEIPNHLATLQLGYTHGNISANIIAKYVSKFQSNFFTTDKEYHDVGDFVTLDASLDYNHKIKDYDAIASIYGKNITDQEYMTKIGWENVGSVFGISYAIKF